MPTWNEAENKLKETGFKKTSYRPGNNFQDSAIKTDHTYNTKEASSQAKASTEVTKDKNINNVKVNKKTDVSNKNKTAVQDQPSSPSKGNSKTIHAATEKRIEAQLSKKFEEKFKKKEEQLKRDLKKNSLQEPSHYIRKSIEEIKSSEVKKDHFCSFGESKLTPKQLYDTLSRIKDLQADDIKYLLCVLEKTDMGKMQDVRIKKDDFGDFGLQFSNLPDAKKKCCDLVKVRKGREPGSKSKAVPFFSLN